MRRKHISFSRLASQACLPEILLSVSAAAVFSAALSKTHKCKLLACRLLMRASCLLTGAHSITRSPIVRLAQVKFLRKGQLPAKESSNTNPICVAKRGFHDTLPRRSLKSKWRETFLGETGNRPGKEGSAHDVYLQAHESELAQLEQAAPALCGILREGHPERILYALLDPISDILYDHASPSFFAATFSLVNPGYFVDPFKKIYRHLKPSLIYGPNEIRTVRALEKQFGALASQLEEIIVKRENAGHSLDLAACRHVLAFAAALADKQMADLVWKEMMPSVQITPDLDCYAYYMEAFCWAGSWKKFEEFNFRVTNASITLRAKGREDFGNFSVGPEKGLKQQMTTLFNELATAGFEGNEAVFTNLMIAMGREGDLEGVKSILKSVWSIDVDLLATVDEEEIETPKHHEAGSPLRPSSSLLFTIAHVFAINNEVLVGLGLVDFVSRQYNLPIPYHVWFQILEYIYVLTKTPTGGRLRRGQSVGHLPQSTFEDVWLMCTDEPHNVKPDISMKMFRSTRLRDNYQFAQAIRIFESCKEDLLEVRDSLAASIDDLLAISSGAQQQHPESRPTPEEDSNLRLRVEGVSGSAGPSSNPIRIKPSDRSQGVAQRLNDETLESDSSAGSDDGPINNESNDDPSRGDETFSDSSSFIIPAQWFDARRNFLSYSLNFERDLQLLIVFVRRMFKMRSWPRSARPTFQRRFFPKLIEQFAGFLPDSIRFEPVKRIDEQEEDTRPLAELFLKQARMDSLLKDWTSKRWGRNLSGELFTTTNARLRNFCSVDSHEELMHVYRTLERDWLNETAYTGKKERHGRQQNAEAFVQSSESSSLDLQKLEPHERELTVKRALGELWRQRGLEDGTIRVNPNYRGPQLPEFPWYDPLIHANRAPSFFQNNQEAYVTREESRPRSRADSAQSLAFDDSEYQYEYEQGVAQEDPSTSLTEQIGNQPKSRRKKSKAKSKDSIDLDDASFLEQAMSRVSSSQQEHPQPQDAQASPFAEYTSKPKAAGSSEAPSDLEQVFLNTDEEMRNQFFDERDEQDLPAADDHDQPERAKDNTSQ